MNIQCVCGKFQAMINNFPKASPGRCVCYCNDCQAFANFLGNPNVLDKNGGTEIIPVYPANYKITSGKEFVQCVRLSPKGLHRWYVSCCKTPVGNITPGLPWVGLSDALFKQTQPEGLERIMGKVVSRIHGKFAKGPLAEKASEKMTFKDFIAVMPFLLKGLILGKQKGSPFYTEKGEPISEPKILSKEEREKFTPVS